MKFSSIFEKEGSFNILEKVNNVYTLQATDVLLTDKCEVPCLKKLSLTSECIAVLTKNYIYLLNSVPKINNDKIYISVRFKVRLRWLSLVEQKHALLGTLDQRFEINLTNGTQSLRLRSKNYNTYQNWIQQIQPLILQHNFTEKYLVDDCIGSGATSKVYKIIDICSNQSFACKRFKKTKMEDLSFFRLVINEIETLSKMRGCPEIVQLKEVQETAHFVYIITELLEGSRVTQQNVKHEIEDIYSLAHFMLKAISRLKEKNVAHRDLKPGNIILRYPNKSIRNNSPVLIDFGFSLKTKGPIHQNTHLRCGTAGYIPPEIFDPNMNEINYECWDIYSAGAILYNAMTGLRLFYNCDNKKRLQLNKESIIDFSVDEFITYPTDCELKSTKLSKEDA